MSIFCITTFSLIRMLLVLQLNNEYANLSVLMVRMSLQIILKLDQPLLFLEKRINSSSSLAACYTVEHM